MDEKEVSGGYDTVFALPLTEDFTCCICFLAFREPMQLPCGHQFCKSCLDKYMETHGDGFCCPVDREEVDKNKIFPDKAMQRMVLSLKVRCNNVKNCCEWSGDLRELEKHLETCAFASVKCTNEGCTLSFLNVNLNDHLTNKCIFRRMICDFCKEGYVYKDEEEHTTCCRYWPITCINVCGETKIPRQQMDNHLQLCRLSILPCEYVALGCNVMGTMSEREEHDKTEMQSHLKIAVRKVNVLEKMAVEKISVLEKEMALTKMAVEKISVLEKEMALMKTLLVVTKEKNVILEKRLEMQEKATLESDKTLHDKFETHVKNSNDRLNTVEKRPVDMMQSFEEKLKKLGTTLELQELTPIQKAYKEVEELKHGVFVWRIDDYHNKIEEARKCKIILYSEVFLTSQNGYSLRLGLSSDPYYGGKRSMYSYVQIARGLNDNVLKWPFSHKLSISLLHYKEETYHVTRKLLPKIQSYKGLGKPTSEYNENFCCNTFIPLVDIRDNGYVCNGTIHVMCKILQ